MNYHKIIIVDDDPTSVFYAKDVLSEIFFTGEVLSFDKPNDFLLYYYNNKHLFIDKILLLLDINMPLKTGFEVLIEIEEEFEEQSNMDVIMVTSSNLKSDLEKASRFVNIIGYVEKPLSKKKLEDIFNAEH